MQDMSLIFFGPPFSGPAFSVHPDKPVDCGVYAAAHALELAINGQQAYLQAPCYAFSPGEHNWSVESQQSFLKEVNVAWRAAENSFGLPSMLTVSSM